GAGVWLAAGGQEAPVAAKYRARAAIEAARGRGVDPSTGPLAAAQEAYGEALKEVSRQTARLRWNRSYGRAEALFGAAARRADLSASLVLRRDEAARGRTDRLLSRADAGFEQMDWISSYIPPRSAIRSDVRKARVSYTEARSLYADGKYERAAAAALQANQTIGSAAARFSRFMHASADPSKGRQYARWVRDTIAWSAANDSKAIIIDKMRRTLTLVSNGARVRTYRAELGINGTQMKLMAGDRATPEGRYRITEKRGPGRTRWYKALMLNYPNEDDLRRFQHAKRRGQISKRAGPGNLIEIHGEGGRGGDWTDGCVALVNRDMDDLFDRVGVGTPVTIVGFEEDDVVRRAGTSRSARRGGTGQASGAGGLR
ncbi:MAG TPA: L,D-transpeptidase, partial [Candidatus Polarisedimenticolia bacterium]|nr:L,D-transpeptidase [Candidatus Polarisedimenticolia bacterium]